MHTRLGRLETALHQLVVRLEKALDRQEIALGVFLAIDWAFNNNSYVSMRAALTKPESITPHDVLELPWRAGWPHRFLVDFPGTSECLEADNKEMFCHLSYGALLLTNCWQCSTGEVSIFKICG
jgi:hypothetical protein